MPCTTRAASSRRLLPRPPWCTIPSLAPSSRQSSPSWCTAAVARARALASWSRSSSEQLLLSVVQASLLCSSSRECVVCGQGGPLAYLVAHMLGWDFGAQGRNDIEPACLYHVQAWRVHPGQACATGCHQVQPECLPLLHQHCWLIVDKVYSHMLSSGIRFASMTFPGRMTFLWARLCWLPCVR